MKVGKIIEFVDYSPAEGCDNPDTCGMTCVKCEECGRVFQDGFMVKRANGEQRFKMETNDDLNEEG